MSVDIIIVNWNSGPLLDRCIQSIYGSVAELNYNVIIVDNNSTDDSILNVKLKNGDILIKAEFNLGFAKACNLGANRSDSEFLLFLNPDTVVNTDTIKSAILFLLSNADVGITGVRQESEDGQLIPSCSRFLRLKYLINDIFGLPKILQGRMKPATIMTDWDHKSSSVVDQVMGSFILIRRADFNRLGGFDEQFFLYFEDMDLAKRILSLGKYSYYLNNVRIIHTGQGSSDSVKDRRLFYSLSSRIKYARKHLSRIESFFVTLLTLFPESFNRIIYALAVKHSISDTLSTIKSYLLLSGWLLKGK